MTQDRTVASGIRWLFLVLALSTAMGVRAQVDLNTNPILAQPGLSVGASVQYSDNVTRVPESATGDGVTTLFATVDLVRTGTRLDYNLIGNLQWADYFSN